MMEGVRATIARVPRRIIKIRNGASLVRASILPDTILRLGQGEQPLHREGLERVRGADRGVTEEGLRRVTSSSTGGMGDSSNSMRAIIRVSRVDLRGV
jgi:hypothetical protein